MNGSNSPDALLRHAIGERALRDIPRILTLQDRVPVSATYGCFDRAYWHYRTADFPSGMAQKQVLPLALAWSLEIPGNPYRGLDAIREAVFAGIGYAARAAHADGSCDDYYPFEQAAGAAAFSLLAMLDAAEIVGLQTSAELEAFLERRAAWLARHEESGRLANHEALICACLVRMGVRDRAQWEPLLQRRLARLLSWQHAEGWFDEYGGADPGYLTLTVALLADIERRRPDLSLRAPIERAVEFLRTVWHPDGSIGGEYSSRATVNYFPHGLEIAGRWLPGALALNDLALPQFDRAAVSDDRLFGHHLTSWLLTWKEWQDERPGPAELPATRIVYPGARMLVDPQATSRLYLGWATGGAFRFYDGDRLVWADTGPTLALADGRVAVTHLAADNRLELGADTIAISGTMTWARAGRLSPVKSVVLRTVMLTLGRWFPGAVRRALQALLVTGRRAAPFQFSRSLTRTPEGFVVRDEIVPRQDWAAVRAAGIGGFQTSLATAMARVWHPAQRQAWLDLSGRLAGLRDREPLVVERRIGEHTLSRSDSSPAKPRRA